MLVYLTGPLFIPSPPPSLQLSEILFPHHLGHYLGVEIHDTPSVSRSLQLLPGMVVTVEPGLYLAPDFTSHLLGPKAEQ